MQRPACILLLLCFLISTLCVREADFFTSTQLTGLHMHYKATEHLDLNSSDLITDHFGNIDSRIHRSPPFSDQKPDKPARAHHLQYSTAFIECYLQMNIIEPVGQLDNFKRATKTNFQSSYIVYIFHPPDRNKYNQVA